MVYKVKILILGKKYNGWSDLRSKNNKTKKLNIAIGS